MSVERPIRVKSADGEFEATAFVTNPSRASLEGPVSARYVEALISGARQSGLPPTYVDGLRSKAR